MKMLTLKELDEFQSVLAARHDNKYAARDWDLLMRKQIMTVIEMARKAAKMMEGK